MLTSSGTGRCTHTLPIERLTEVLGAVQSQGDASLGFLSRPSLGAIVIAAAHVVSHMGSWARTGKLGGGFNKTQIVSGVQIKHCCLSKKNELKIRAISILVEKRKRSLIHGKQGVVLP